MPDDAYREDAQKYEQSLQKALRIVAELVPYPLHAVLEYEFAPQDRFAYKMAELTGESILFKTLQVETPERLPRHSIGLWHKDRESLLPLDPLPDLRTVSRVPLRRTRSSSKRLTATSDAPT